MSEPRTYHQARWNEPVIMELGAPGRRGAGRHVHEEADPADLDDAGRGPRLQGGAFQLRDHRFPLAAATAAM